jgi:hypothetical protein
MGPPERRDALAERNEHSAGRDRDTGGGGGRVARFDPLAAFWIILLAGIALAIFALWSMLYRPIASVAAE